jgi:hypothetical protein
MKKKQEELTQWDKTEPNPSQFLLSEHSTENGPASLVESYNLKTGVGTIEGNVKFCYLLGEVVHEGKFIYIKEVFRTDKLFNSSPK